MPKRISKEAEEAVKTEAEVEAEVIDYKKLICAALIETGREGMAELTEYMDKIGFFTAPCSGGNHLCKEGGLAEHSWNVKTNAEKIGGALYGKEAEDVKSELHHNIVIAALLHDLGKCGDYGKQMYVDNILKSGKRSDAKPFKRNSDLSAVPHAVRSIKIATLFVDLTEDEEWAILCHDGLYDFMKYEMQGHETPLSLIIHWADMWSCKVIEKEDAEEGE